MSRKIGFPAWQVRVEVRSHRDVVALAGYLAAQGWRVRRRRRHLLVGADCEDDAKGLVRELSGDGGADAETAFRVGRVSYSYMLFDASGTQVFGGGGPLVRSFSSPGQQTRRSSRRTIGYTRILSQVRGERRAVPHADERVLGQPDRGPVRALAHLCHEQLGLPESPRAGPHAAGLPALAQRPGLATPTCWAPSAASAPASAANASNAGAAPNPRLPNQSGERSWSTH